jgi:hypothetical protein
MSAELQEVEQETVVSVEDDIRSAIDEIENKPTDEPVEEIQKDVAPAKQRDETGKFAKAPKEVKVKETPEAQVQTPAPEIESPQSLPATLKEDWGKAPQSVRDWVKKRELDQHQAMTRHDGDLNMGREMKDVIAPYMPIIQAEGGTPAKAVQSLLNTAYQLRTASPERKAQLIGEIAQTYGVDLGQVQHAPQIDPALQQVLNRMDGIESKFTQQMTLQERAEHDKVMSEVSAFSADPKNVHYEQVKPTMATLLGSGQAKDLQEAYDKAIWSDPTIRASLLQAQAVEETKKRNEEFTKKKAAAVSVTGSPGVHSSSSTPRNNNSVEDDVRAALEEISG